MELKLHPNDALSALTSVGTL